MKSIFKRFLCFVAVVASFFVVGTVANAETWVKYKVVVDSGKYSAIKNPLTHFSTGKDVLISKGDETVKMHILSTAAVRDRYTKAETGLALYLMYNVDAPECPTWVRDAVWNVVMKNIRVSSEALPSGEVLLCDGCRFKKIRKTDEEYVGKLDSEQRKKLRDSLTNHEQKEHCINVGLLLALERYKDQ